jgi:hypothetical protein
MLFAIGSLLSPALLAQLLARENVRSGTVEGDRVLPLVMYEGRSTVS